MLLLDLNNRYFWVASKQLHGEPPPAEIATKVRSLAFQIADKLREADDVPYLEEILTVLMSEDAYKTANDRAKALDAVIGNIGKIVHPRYTKLIHDISEKNVRGFVARPPDHQNNAPAPMNQFPGTIDGEKNR